MKIQDYSKIKGSEKYRFIVKYRTAVKIQDYSKIKDNEKYRKIVKYRMTEEYSMTKIHEDCKNRGWWEK